MKYIMKDSEYRSRLCQKCFLSKADIFGYYTKSSLTRQACDICSKVDFFIFTTQKVKKTVTR